MYRLQAERDFIKIIIIKNLIIYIKDLKKCIYNDYIKKSRKQRFKVKKKL